MPFHRTPAEMAADASFARSPVGESQSRHMLWLTDADLEQIGPEPQTSSRRIDYTDPQAVQSARLANDKWKTWWSSVGHHVAIRRREALSDPAWAEEYERLLKDRRLAGPAELADLQAEWDAYEAAHPERGLTSEEIARRSKSWQRRSELVKEYHNLKRRNPSSPRLSEILDEMRECDRICDELYALEHSRPSLKIAA